MVGFISSLNGGQDWSDPEALAGPIQLSQVAPTSQGVMVGDYISTSFLAGQQRVVAAFAVGLPPPTGAPFDEPMFSALQKVRGGQHHMNADPALAGPDSATAGAEEEPPATAF